MRVGDKVEWNWGDGSATGEIKKRYTQKITLKIKGSDVTRNASNDDPAFLIEQEDGDEVLKSASELNAA
ncbi:MAG: DUF2945 domain-containing protein [Pseudomonadota bacterium]